MISFKLRTPKVGLVRKKKTFVDVIKGGEVVATIEPEDENIMIKYFDKESDNGSFIVIFFDL